MHFETVFDVAVSGYQSWWVPAFGLTFAILGGVMVLFPRETGLLLSGIPKNRAYGWMVFIFASVWTFWTFAGTYNAYVVARDALATGAYRVVEGPVTNFIPMRRGRGESFTVAGHQFTYSDYPIGPGFNHTRSHGGPIDNGVYVRVTYDRRDTILRLEIGR
jgi:hypothetical protein